MSCGGTISDFDSIRSNALAEKTLSIQLKSKLKHQKYENPLE